jgi:homoserine/homoserine lactone efflux protein
LFALTVFVASMIPGPSMLLALSHGMQHGSRKTIVSAFGNVTVTLIQAFISIAGLGTVLLASESVFFAIKWAGAAYLVYMGINIFFSSKWSLSQSEDASAQSDSKGRMFLQAAFVTAGNPKAIVFFTAVFPQFIDPNIGFLFQCSVLLSILAVIAFCCFMCYAIGGQKIVMLYSRANVGKYVKRVIGGTFIGAGIGLALSK